MNDYLAAMSKYFVFSGRASRKQYWMFALISLVIMVACNALDPVLDTVLRFDMSGMPRSGQGDPVSIKFSIGILTTISYFAHLVPGFAAAVRRLHDSNKSAWIIVLGFIPLVNFYVLYLLIRAGTPGPNSYGPSPLRPPVLSPKIVAA